MTVKYRDSSTIAIGVINAHGRTLVRMSTLVDWLVENEPTFRKTRLPSLYSDLAQQKASNPDGYAANASSWQNALTRAALAGRLPTEQKIILRVSHQLLDDLRSSQYGLPTGLGAVLDDAVRDGKMLDLNEFQKLDHSIFEKSWLPTPWSVIQWTLRQAGLVSQATYNQSGRLRSGDLVLIEALEDFAKKTVALQEQRNHAVTDLVMTREAFTALVAQTGLGSLSAAEIGIMLKFLARDKQCISYDSRTVKFKSRSAARPEPLTEEDATIASMKDLIASLESQISSLTSRVSTLQETAYSAVQSKNKAAALSALRSKKLAEKSLQSRIDALHQLEEVYAKIEQAVDQAQIMQVLQSSATTLRNLNQRIGGVEKVDTVMEDLREQMGQVDEVGQILQEPVGETTVLDEDEVDKELAALEKEEATKKEETQAEAVRTRLAELEKTEAAAKAEAKTQHEAISKEDAELESSSQKLERIRLEDDDTAAPGLRQQEHAALEAV